MTLFLRALPIINTRLTCLHAFTLINKHLTRLFLPCFVFLIVRYGFRLKNPRKATGPDFICLKVIQFASSVIDSHLYNITIKDLGKNKYSEESRTALVKPIFKKNERNKIRNYRHFKCIISIVNGMPKIHERCIHNSLTSYTVTILANFISAYNKSYSSNHVSLRLLENWKKSRDIQHLWVLFLWISQDFWLYSSWFTWCKTSCKWFIRGCSNFCVILKT